MSVKNADIADDGSTSNERFEAELVAVLRNLAVRAVLDTLHSERKSRR